MLVCVLAQIRAASRRFLRIVHFSVQSNHIHLLVEANDGILLSKGMKGFAVRVARRLNQLLGCRGAIWEDRYHAHYLRTPREVRNALIYVLRNRIKHGGSWGIDRCSSAPYFRGWSQDVPSPVRASPEGPPVATAETWLLATGWKRLGTIDADERPRLARRDEGLRQPT
jgi:putative transposase